MKYASRPLIQNTEYLIKELHLTHKGGRGSSFIPYEKGFSNLPEPKRKKVQYETVPTISSTEGLPIEWYSILLFFISVKV